MQRATPKFTQYATKAGDDTPALGLLIHAVMTSLIVMLLQLPAAGHMSIEEEDTPPNEPQVSDLLPPDLAGLRPIESQARAMIDEINKATVSVHLGRRGNSTATGVFIDDDLVLTAGHVGETPGRRVTVIQHDGRRLEGKTLGQIFQDDVDLGLIRVDTDGLDDIPRIAFGTSDDVKRGDWVLLLGHDSVSRDTIHNTPSARLGRVLRNTRNRLDVDAPFDAGDSGGPVFDLQGRLLGIVSRCGHHPWQNVATGIGAIREYIPRLESVEEDMEMLQKPQSVHRHVRSPEKSKRDPELLQNLAHLAWPVTPSIVQIFSEDRLVAHGTIVDDELVLTKASLFARETDDPLILTNDDRRFNTVTPLAVDPELDLILLEVIGLEAPQLMWAEPPADAGSIVVVPRMDGTVRSMGIVCRDEDTMESTPEIKPFVGVGFRTSSRPPGLTITSVVASSPAAHAGLERGDIMREIDRHPIPDRNSLRKTLDLYGIGDLVTLEIDRNGESKDIPLRLGLRPATEIRWTPGNTSLGTNRHSTGYGRVLLTDAVIDPHQVGLPIMDLDGRPIGMVIARRGRTTTVLLPSDRVRNALKELRAAVLEHDLEDRLAVYRIRATESTRGVLDLPAEDAIPRGDTLRRARRDDGQVTYGSWSEGDDALEWLVRIDRPGVFMAEIHASCSNRSAGTPFRLHVGDTSLNGHVESTGGWDEFETTEVGEFRVLEPGEFLVRLEPMATPRNNLMVLSGLQLVRLADVAD
ncbi:MAG: trypsin-like peptidase domain-containing protein [Phycisphaerales bacterium]|nr:trypsin-like peptidase domain-containing protein [Phycisphaerales bacterium]